ncbi:MAG: PorP/SprF family type IX secretion system membrane protein [Bacteroidota bacterium]
MKKIVIILFCFLMLGSIKSQQIHRALFYSTPVFNNPAMCALSGGKFVVGTSYKNQWKSLGADFKTKTINIGKTIIFSRKGHIAGFEFSLLQDDAAGLKTTNVNFSFAPDLVFSVGDQQSRVRFGLLGGFVTRSLNTANFTFENQFTGTGFNQALPSGETIYFVKKTIPIISFGFLYYNLPRQLERRQVNPFFGFAFNNVVKSDASFYENAYVHEQTTRFVVHGGLRFDNHFAFEITPMVNYMKEAIDQELSAGINFKYNFTEFTSARFASSKRNISVGYMYRKRGGMVFYMGGEFMNTILGIGYDINSKGLMIGTSPQESIEICLKFRIKGNHNSTRFTTGGKGFYFENLPVPMY